MTSSSHFLEGLLMQAKSSNGRSARVFEEAVEKDAELKELFEQNAMRVYTGYVEDPRCTRNAWIETCTPISTSLTSKEAAFL